MDSAVASDSRLHRLRKLLLAIGYYLTAMLGSLWIATSFIVTGVNFPKQSWSIMVQHCTMRLSWGNKADPIYWFHLTTPSGLFQSVFDEIMIDNPLKTNTGYVRSVSIPLGRPFIAALAATCLLYWIQRKKKPTSVCRVCEYELLGNISGICPECGTPVPVSQQSAH